MATTTKKTTKKENTEETKVKKTKKTATAVSGSKTTAKKTKVSASNSTAVSKTEKKAPKSSKTKEKTEKKSTHKTKTAASDTKKTSSTKKTSTAKKSNIAKKVTDTKKTEEQNEKEKQQKILEEQKKIEEAKKAAEEAAARKRIEEENARRKLAEEEAKRKAAEEEAKRKAEEEAKKPKLPTITINELITVKELAEKMNLKVGDVLRKLMAMGTLATINQRLDTDTAILLANEFGFDAKLSSLYEEENIKEDSAEDDKANLQPRSPIVTIMGHVDHGKTSLLDAIRHSNVIAGEAGGITQHIGAYRVKTSTGEITFLDTPGHEAFTAMRSRGAQATDIVILVVSAADGVMPQTIEAINHAKAANVPIVVAVNKVDKIGYDFDDPNKDMMSYPSINSLMNELAYEHDLLPESMGGTTVYVPISAKKRQGIQELLDIILLSADILELKADAKRKARGLVIEARLDKGRGPVSTVLVQKGTLKVGDFISAGEAHGKVRAMINDKGDRIKEAPPSTPVEIQGLDKVPNAGEIFIAHESDKEAKNFADTFIAQNKLQKIAESKKKVSLEELYNQIQTGNLKTLNLIVKADVQGSVEAVKKELEDLSNEEVRVDVIHSGVGTINESDVVLASAGKAIIIGFNVRIDAGAKETAEREGVDVKFYDVIYRATNDVSDAIKGMLAPVYEERITGHAEVRQIFKASKVGNIAGAFVKDGIIKKECKVRISREGEQIFEGDLASLKRFKDDVKEVKEGFECGLVFDGFDGIHEGDLVEAYEMVEVPRT